MKVCFEYVGFVRWWVDLGGEGQAAWLSAIGGLIAVGLTAWFYFKDRRERRNAEKQAAAAHQRERAYRAWKLSMQLGRVVATHVGFLEHIADQFEKQPGGMAAVPSTLRIHWAPPDPKKLNELMRDMSDLSRGTQATLINYLNWAEILNECFTRLVIEIDGHLDVEQFRPFIVNVREGAVAAKAAGHALQDEIARNKYAENE